MDEFYDQKATKAGDDTDGDQNDGSDGTARNYWDPAVWRWQ